MMIEYFVIRDFLWVHIHLSKCWRSTCLSVEILKGYMLISQNAKGVHGRGSRSQLFPTPLLFQNFWIRVRQFFKFKNPTPVQVAAPVIDPTVIYPHFYLNDHTESCYCRNWKVIPGPFFPKYLTPGPKEKRWILPESTLALRIQSHLWCMVNKRLGTPVGIPVHKVWSKIKKIID